MQLGPRQKYVKLINTPTPTASLVTLDSCIGSMKADALGSLTHSLGHCTWYLERLHHFTQCLPPPRDQGGNDFCVISQAGGATAKLQEPGWGHIQGEDDFRQSSRGDCFIMTNCWYFHKILHLEFYKFRLRRYLIFF